MHVNLIICDNWADMFLDIAYQFEHWCNSRNISTSVIPVQQSTDDKDTINVLFGTHYIQNIAYIKPNSILTDWDNVSLVHKHFLPEFFQKYTIWSYSRKTVNYLKSLYPERPIFYFKMGYVPRFDFSHKFPSSFVFDVCFLGNHSERRIKIFEALHKAGLRCGFINQNLWGEQRSMLYMHSKVVMSFYTNQDTFEYCLGSRVWPTVSTKAFIVSETSLSEDVNNEYADITVIVPYEKLVETVCYYVSHDEEREVLRNKFYETAKNSVCDIEGFSLS